MQNPPRVSKRQNMNHQPLTDREHCPIATKLSILKQFLSHTPCRSQATDMHTAKQHHVFLAVAFLVCTSCRSDVFNEPEPWQIEEETSCLPWQAEHEGSCINIPPQGTYTLTLDQVESNCSAVPDEWRDILFTLNPTIEISFFFDQHNNNKLTNLKTYSSIPMPRLFPLHAVAAGNADIQEDKITFKNLKTTTPLNIKTTLNHNTKSAHINTIVELTLLDRFDNQDFPFGPKAPCKETYSYSMNLIEECPFYCASRSEPTEGYELYPEMSGNEFYPNGPTPNLHWPELVHICFCVER